MVRDLNANYLEPLRKAYPAASPGPEGDAPKVNCTTCHQGAYKPLYGANMLKDYPELGAPVKVASLAPVAIPGGSPSATEAVAVVTATMVKFYFAVGKNDLPANAKDVARTRSPSRRPTRRSSCPATTTRRAMRRSTTTSRRRVPRRCATS